LAGRYETALFEEPQPTAKETNTPVEGTALVDTPAPRSKPVFDPGLVVHQMEAWMPDVLASCKLRGFVNDMGGEVIESVPGKIRVRLGGPNGDGGSWFGIRRKASIIDMELLLERNNPQQPSVLHITVLMSSPDRKTALSTAWRNRCGQIFCELRGYLAGSSVG
jgi:serine/threonine-protein kinase